MLNVRVLGDPSGRTVLALHGLNGDGDQLADLGVRLGHRLVCPDLRGHGRSPGEPPWHLDQVVSDVVALSLSGPLDVIGYSYGGLVAVALAARRPDLIDRLVLLDPAIGLAPDFVAPMAERALHAETGDGHARPEAVITAFSDSCRLLPPPVQPTLLVRTAGNPRGTEAFAASCASARHVRVETLDCGHRLLAEQPAQTAALVRSFLDPPVPA
jgi:lipase